MQILSVQTSHKIENTANQSGEIKLEWFYYFKLIFNALCHLCSVIQSVTSIKVCKKQKNNHIFFLMHEQLLLLMQKCKYDLMPSLFARARRHISRSLSASKSTESIRLII